MSDAAQFSGVVTSSIFKGVHYEMMVTTSEGFEFMIQDYHCFELGKTVGMRVKPFDIHVMKKERVRNTFAGTIVDKFRVKFLGNTFECNEAANYAAGTEVNVFVDFGDVTLFDSENDGDLKGVIRLILYKGNHYHLTILVEGTDHIFVDTNDVWDDGDRVGISISPESIHLEKV